MCQAFVLSVTVRVPGYMCIATCHRSCYVVYRGGCSLTLILHGFIVVTFVSPTDVLSVGPWSTLKELQDAELQKLAKALPLSVLQSRATSTTRKYLGAFKRWKSWATEHQLVVFPVEATNLALYLQHLGESKSCKSAVEEAVHGLSWVHTIAGITTPTSSPFVQATLEGLKRTFAKPICKKLPFTIEMLQAIVRDAKKADTLSSLRLAAICLISFAGFLCFDELANIRPVIWRSVRTI